MAGPWGFNLRATLPFVTDGPTESAVLGDLYPTVFSNGLTAGWIDEPEERDRNSSFDPRLAGVAQRGNDGTQKTLQVDLPAPGNYAITIALGDGDNPQDYQYLQVLDGATPLITIADADGTANQHFDDATGSDYDAATWPGSNTPVTVTLVGSTLNFVLGSPGVQAGNSTLAHISIAAIAPTQSATTQPAYRQPVPMRQGAGGFARGKPFRFATSGQVTPVIIPPYSPPAFVDPIPMRPGPTGLAKGVVFAFATSAPVPIVQPPTFSDTTLPFVLTIPRVPTAGGIVLGTPFAFATSAPVPRVSGPRRRNRLIT